MPKLSSTLIGWSSTIPMVTSFKRQHVIMARGVKTASLSRVSDGVLAA